MKSKLYVSQEYFKVSPQNSGFVMMKDGEMYFYQIEEKEGTVLDKNLCVWDDLREVANIDSEDVLMYKKSLPFNGNKVSHEDIFKQLILQYEMKTPVIHKSALGNNRGL